METAGYLGMRFLALLSTFSISEEDFSDIGLCTCIFYSYDSSNDRCVVPTYIGEALSSAALATNFVQETVPTADVYMFKPDAVALGMKCDSLTSMSHQVMPTRVSY